jgi:FAD:protein FMN transferase
MRRQERGIHAASTAGFTRVPGESGVSSYRIVKRHECRAPAALTVRARRLPILSVLALSVVVLAGCRSPGSSLPLHRFEFTHPAMGTMFTVTLYAPDAATAESGSQAAFHRIDALEDVMSDYQADSELMRLCAQPYGKPVPVSADLFDVLQESIKYAKLSDGAFDVTVGPYVRLWRFARKRKVLPTAAELAAAREAVGWHKLRLDSRSRTVTLLVPNMRLDLGGIGKGYTADRVLRLLRYRGLNRALVAASGDIAIGDPPPGQPAWKVGISAIDERNNQASRTVLLHNAGVSTSGDSEQFIEVNGVRYSHILDPATGLGLTNRIQSTIVAPNSTITDGLDTALCILGPERALALVDSLPHTAAIILIKEDGRDRAFLSRRFRRLLRQ